MKKKVVRVRKRTDAMGAFHLNKVVIRKSLAALEKHVIVFDGWHSKPAHADSRAVRGMEEKDVFQDMDMHQCSVLDDCSPCIEEAMTHTLMPLTTQVRVRPGAVIHNYVAVMNVLSINEARYFVNIMDKASGHVRSFHMKEKGKAAELLKRQVCWVEWQSGCIVKKISFDGGRENPKGLKHIKAQGI